MKAIYKITNVKTGHFYIGSTTNVIRRWMCHKNRLRKGNHENIHLQNAWNKDGETSFNFSIVLNLSDVSSYEDILKEEQKLLDENYGKSWCYNLVSKAIIDKDDAKKIISKKLLGYRNPMFGKTHTEEARKKISEAAKKRKHKPETIEKIKASSTGKNNPMYGVRLTGAKNHMFGKKHTKEALQKMRDAHSKTIRRPRKKYEFFHSELGTHILSAQDFIKLFGLSISTIYKLSRNIKVVNSQGWKILKTIDPFHEQG